MRQSLTEDGQDTLIGAILDDKYRVEERVGEGGMGKVYRATHIHMDHTVAIKILHAHLASDQMALGRFRREARAAAYIHHPNAVAVSDFGVARGIGVAYLVMEFLQGVDLRAVIKEKKQLNCEESFLVVQQTCAALHAAHAKGIIHRDLKPDNIWLFKDEDGIEHVKVLDFGIAKLMTADASVLTQQGMIMGTPSYMSPEQCGGEELDMRSDVYSMGVILYEMLTGQVPFQASNPIGVALKHTVEPPRPPRQLRADLPEPIEAVILRALNKKREERQESAAQLAQEFEQALYTTGIEPTQPISQSIPPPAIHVPLIEAGASTGPVEVAPASPTPLRSTANRNFITRLMGRTLGSLRRAPAQGKTQDMASEPSRAPAQASHDLFSNLTSTRTNARFYLFIGIAVALALAVFAAIKLTSVPGAQTSVRSVPASQAEAPPSGMVRVPGGAFAMGSDDPKSDYAARPQHVVTVSAFFLDVDEVTHEQYQEFIEQTGHAVPPHWVNKKYPSGAARFPVYNVSWEDANAYAKWKGKRLPTEGEWEYAVRGEAGSIYPWGGKGWTGDNANIRETGLDGPAPVGSYPAGRSWCGVNDMTGNVAEWVAGYYRPYPGGGGSPDPRAKIYRGGSYNDSRDELLTVKRRFTSADTKHPEIGFRCAVDAPESARK